MAGLFLLLYIGGLDPALDPDDHFFQLKTISKEAHLEKNRGCISFPKGAQEDWCQ